MFICDALKLKILYAGQSVSSIMTLRRLPPYAKAVLCVMVSLIGVHLVQPVILLPHDTWLHQGLLTEHSLQSSLQ